MRISDWSSDVCSSDLKTMKPVLTLLGLGAACMACCLPVIAPALAGLGLTGIGIAGLGVAALGWAAGLAIGVAFLAAGILWMRRRQIGRASCRERVCQYVCISVVAVSLQQKTHHIHSTTQTN